MELSVATLRENSLGMCIAVFMIFTNLGPAIRVPSGIRHTGNLSLSPSQQSFGIYLRSVVDL